MITEAELDTIIRDIVADYQPRLEILEFEKERYERLYENSVNENNDLEFQRNLFQGLLVGSIVIVLVESVFLVLK